MWGKPSAPTDTVGKNTRTPVQRYELRRRNVAATAGETPSRTPGREIGVGDLSATKRIPKDATRRGYPDPKKAEGALAFAGVPLESIGSETSRPQGRGSTGSSPDSTGTARPSSVGTGKGDSGSTTEGSSTRSSTNQGTLPPTNGNEEGATTFGVENGDGYREGFIDSPLATPPPPMVEGDAIPLDSSWPRRVTFSAETVHSVQTGGTATTQNETSLPLSPSPRRAGNGMAVRFRGVAAAAVRVLSPRRSFSPTAFGGTGNSFLDDAEPTTEEEEELLMYDLLDVDCDGTVSRQDLYAFLTLYPEVVLSSNSAADSRDGEGWSKSEKRNGKGREGNTPPPFARRGQHHNLRSSLTFPLPPASSPTKQVDSVSSIVLDEPQPPSMIPAVADVLKSQRVRNHDEALADVTRWRLTWYQTLFHFTNVLIHLAVDDNSTAFDAPFGAAMSSSDNTGRLDESPNAQSAASVPAFVSFKAFRRLRQKVSAIAQTTSNNTQMILLLDLGILQRLVTFLEKVSSIARGLRAEQLLRESMDDSCRLRKEKQNPSKGDSEKSQKAGGTSSRNGGASSGKKGNRGGLPHSLSLSTFAKATSFYLRRSLSPSRTPTTSPQRNRNSETAVGAGGNAFSATTATANPRQSRKSKKATHSVVSRFWLASAWEERRGVLQTPVALRFGEYLLKRKAEGQEREMKHFVRLYRHMMGFQSATQLMMKDSGNRLRLEAASTSRGRRPFERTFSAAGAGAGAGGGGGEAGGPTVAAQKKETVDSVLRHIAQPEPLSMLGELSSVERKQIRQARRWALIRACFIGFIAAIVLGIIEVTAAQLFLGSKEQLGDGLTKATTTTWNVVYATVASWFSSDAGTGDTSDNATATGNASSSAIAAAGLAALNSTTSAVSDILSNSSSNGTVAGSGNETSSIFLAGDISKKLGVSEGSLAYWLTLLVATIVVSVFEVGSLFTDSLNTAFHYARTAGIPLHHHTNLRSERFMRNKENEAVAIKESLARKRVRFVISSIARAAMDLPATTETILNIEAEHTHTSAILKAIQNLAKNLQYSFVTLFVRIIASRVLSKFAVPFIATPLLMLWNFLIVRRNIDGASSVVKAAVGVEKLIRDVLECYLPATTLHTKDGAIYAPAQVYQAMVKLASYCCFRLERVHPSLHLCLVSIVASCDPHHRGITKFLGDGIPHLPSFQPTGPSSKKRKNTQESDHDDDDGWSDRENGDTPGKEKTLEKGKEKKQRDKTKKKTTEGQLSEDQVQYGFAKELITLLNEVESSSRRRRCLFGRGDGYADDAIQEHDVLAQLVFPELNPSFGLLERKHRMLLLSLVAVIAIVVEDDPTALHPLLFFLAGIKPPEHGFFGPKPSASTATRYQTSFSRPDKALLCHLASLRSQYNEGFAVNIYQVTKALEAFITF